MADVLPSSGPYTTGREHRTRKGNLFRRWCGLNVCVFHSVLGRSWSWSVGDKDGCWFSGHSYHDVETATSALIVELRRVAFTEDRQGKHNAQLDEFLVHLTRHPDDDGVRGILADWLLDNVPKMELSIRCLPRWFVEEIINDAGGWDSWQIDDMGRTILHGREAVWSDRREGDDLSELKQVAVRAGMVLAWCRPSDVPLGKFRVLLFQPLRMVSLRGRRFVTGK